MAAYTAIDNPEAYFQVKTYTGNGTAIGSGGLANTFDGDTDMQPDMVWIKGRSFADNHFITDSVRGVTKTIFPDLTAAEETQTEALTAFGSDGFTVGSMLEGNTSSGTHVAWCWKESATAGFDIVSFTGNVTNRTISHSLSAVPKIMIIKNREATEHWVVYHQKNTSAPETDYLLLNLANPAADGVTVWNDTAPTSSVFTVSTSPAVNGDGEGMIMYLWSEKQGFSKFGSFEGTADADGPFVYLGFRPAYVTLKNIDEASGEGWMTYDNKRLGYNEGNSYFQANTAAAEASGNNEIDFLSNGFKLRSSNTASNRADTHIYMAFAEAPLVNSNGVPCNAR